MAFETVDLDTTNYQKWKIRMGEYLEALHLAPTQFCDEPGF